MLSPHIDFSGLTFQLILTVALCSHFPDVLFSFKTTLQALAQTSVYLAYLSPYEWFVSLPTQLKQNLGFSTSPSLPLSVHCC